MRSILNMVKRGPTEHYCLTETERANVLDACSGPEERVIILLPLYVGLRASEAIHLDARWINDDGNLRIPYQMVCRCLECSRRNKNRGHWVPKTKAGIRELGIPKLVSSELDPFLAQYPAGLNMSRFAFYRRVKKVLRHAGVVIPGLGGDTAFPHILRATCATMLAAGGMNAPQLCYHMGWGDIGMADRYINRASMRATAPAAARSIFGG